MMNLRYPLLFLCLLPAVAPLLCYICAFPSISPWNCIKFPRTCPLGHLCMSSRSVGVKGDTRVVLHEKGCIFRTLCGIKGEKYTMGLNFNFTLECCGTPLCNGATRATHYWTVTLLSPLIFIPTLVLTLVSG